jgi:GTP pyrophosphokinase
VNHKLVPIGYKLRSGDQIEIITSNKQKPSEDWLSLVVTAKAKNRIKDTMRDEKRKFADDGKYILERKFASLGAPLSQFNIDELVSYYKISSPLDLFYRIALKQIDLKELKEFSVISEKIVLIKVPEIELEKNQANLSKGVLKKDTELIIFGESSDRIVYTLANCCKPIPGDDVFGFVSTGKGLVIHRTNCSNAARLFSNYEHRVVKTKWAKNKEISFLTGLRITGLDDVGVIHKITNLISGELKLNINAITVEAKEGIFEGNIRLFVHDKDELDMLFQRLKELPGIQDVHRYDLEG